MENHILGTWIELHISMEYVFKRTIVFSKSGKNNFPAITISTVITGEDFLQFPSHLVSLCGSAQAAQHFLKENGH